jgi:ureidoglycolate dehydrogenase (NAD+)
MILILWFYLIFLWSRAFAAPAKNGDSFVLDMATSTVALGKVEISQRRGMEIPNTWGVNEQG